MLFNRCRATLLVVVWLVGLGIVSSRPFGSECTAQDSASELENSMASNYETGYAATQGTEASGAEVPPDVLRAIYPQHTQSSDQLASEQSYFEQSDNALGLQLGSSDHVDEPTRQAQFNDRLVEQMNSSTNHQLTQQPTPQSYDGCTQQPAQVSVDQGDQFEVLRNTLDQTANRQPTAGSSNEQPGPGPHNLPPEFDSRFDQQVAPASHISPLEGSPQPKTVVDLPRHDRHRSKNYARSNQVKTSLTQLLANSNRDSITLAENRGKTKTKLGRATPTLTETIQRIAISLCLVLTVAFLLLVVAKRWWAGAKSTSLSFKGSKPSRMGLPIQILNQIRLDAKSQLYLVRANEQTILVAVDAGGIKSVLPLQSDFGSALEQFSQPVETGSRSIVQEIEKELGQPSLYTPASVMASVYSQQSNTLTSASDKLTSRDEITRQAKSTTDVEIEMKRKLAELLRGSLLNQKQ